MKKINKFLIMGLMVLLMPIMADAATLNLDTAHKEDNNKGELRIPLRLDVTSSDTILNVTVNCSTEGDLSASCKFEAPSNTDIILTRNIYTYVSGGTSKAFPEGERELGYLVIQNSEATRREIEFSITVEKVAGLNYNDGKYKSFVSAKAAPKEISHDATLKTLKLSQGTMSPEFNPNTYEYTVYGIADTINSVNIVSWDCTVPNSCNPTIAGNGGSRKIALAQGENKVEIVVTAESNDDADTKTYTLNIIRGDNGYNSAKLASLSFGEYTLTPAFKSDVKEYTLTVPNNVTSLVNIYKLEKQDKNATESLNGFENLVVGENKATITIDNVNGDETVTYVINITRMSDTEIEVLKYKNGEITFRDSEGVQNVLSEEDFKKQYEDEWKKIEDGTYKFDEDGNIVRVTFTSDEEEKKEKKKNNTWIIVIIIVVGLIIIGVSGFFIFKKKKPADSENKDENEENTESDEDSEDEEDKDAEEEIEEKKTTKRKSNKETEASEKDPEIENDTMEIDEALVDLMSTKKYDFKDEE